MKNNYLSEREMNVMQVLWKYEKPMTVTEIVESEKELTTPTVHTVLRKLLDKGYVQVIDTVQTGKVFARQYKAKKTQDEEIEEKIEKCMKNSNSSHLIIPISNSHYGSNSLPTKTQFH